MRISDWSSDVCSSDLTVPGYIFGAGKNGQIDAMADGPEIERRRPGIVHQRHDSPCLGHRDDRGHILHFDGEASSAFQDNGACPPSAKCINAAAVHRAITHGGDSPGPHTISAQGTASHIDTLHQHTHVEEPPFTTQNTMHH